MKIKIQNYQIIEDEEINLDGISLLVGNNNNGKTAIVRAIKAAVHGSPGGDFIRDGQKKAKIEIDFPEKDGFKSLKIAWKKFKDKGAVYNVNGTEYKRLGRSVPSVYEQEGLQEIKTGHVKVHLNFWSQWEAPFLIADPPSHLFEFFSQIRKEAVLIPVVDGMQSDLANIKSQALVLEGNIQAYKQQKAEVGEQIKGLREKVKAQSIVENACRTYQELGNVLTLVSRLQEVRAVRKDAEKRLIKISDGHHNLTCLIRRIGKKNGKLYAAHDFTVKKQKVQKQLFRFSKIGVLEKVQERTRKRVEELEKYKRLLSLFSELKYLGEKKKTNMQDIQSRERTKIQVTAALSAVIKRCGGVCPVCEREGFNAKSVC